LFKLFKGLILNFEAGEGFKPPYYCFANRDLIRQTSGHGTKIRQIIEIKKFEASTGFEPVTSFWEVEAYETPEIDHLL
jgi:hypothetical protein